MNSEDVEEQKQTLLSIKDVEMWVTHLDSAKKRRQAGARKAAAIAILTVYKQLF